MRQLGSQAPEVVCRCRAALPLCSILPALDDLCTNVCPPANPRRGRNVMDYAAEGSEVRRVLEARIAEMESRAARLQVRRVRVS